MSWPKRATVLTYCAPCVIAIGGHSLRTITHAAPLCQPHAKFHLLSLFVYHLDRPPSLTKNSLTGHCKKRKILTRHSTFCGEDVIGWGEDAGVDHGATGKCRFTGHNEHTWSFAWFSGAPSFISAPEQSPPLPPPDGKFFGLETCNFGTSGPMTLIPPVGYLNSGFHFTLMRFD